METYHYTAWRGGYPATETLAPGHGGQVTAWPAATCRDPSRATVAKQLGLDPGDPTWVFWHDPYGDCAKAVVREVGRSLARITQG